MKNANFRPAQPFKIFLPALLALAILQFACTFPGAQAQPTAQASPAAILPDLTVSSISLQMMGQSNYGCVAAYAPYEIEAVIANQGKAPATGIVVERLPGAQALIAALAPGESQPVRFPAVSADGRYTVQVDPGNLIPESDESNNSRSFLAPTPTPPPLCPTQPPAAPTPSPLDGLIYSCSDMNQAQTWMVAAGNQRVKLFDGLNPRLSPDGSQAVYEAGGGLWIADLASKATRNLTNTPDKTETAAQWWPANPGKIVYKVLLASGSFQANNPSGILMVINADGSGNEMIGGGPVDGLPSLSGDGKIAYDIMGNPMIYEAGAGEHLFDAMAFGLQLKVKPEFVSPAWSLDGKALLWWMVENPLEENRIYDLLRFDLNDRSYTKIYTATTAGGAQGWFPTPLWSPDGSRLALQTWDQQNSRSLVVGRADGSQWQVFGLASSPLWSPDGQRLFYALWQPNSDAFQAVQVSVPELPTGPAQPVDLPENCAPSGWLK